MNARPADSLDADEQRLRNMRARKAERIKRFQDVKTRAMGVDKDYVAQQMAEKAAKAAAEKEADMMLAQQNSMVVDLLSRQQQEEYLERKAASEALRDSQLAQAAERAARIDPDDVKNDALVDPDSVGPSALLAFAGEDATGPERRRVQQKQIQDWADQQLAGKHAAAAEEKQADMDYAAYLQQVDTVRGQVEAEEAAARKQANDEFRAENERLLKMKAERQHAERNADAAASLAEEQYKLSQVEDLSSGESALGAHRIRKDHYKGMSRDQIAAIYAENDAIVAAKNAAKDAEKAEDLAWAAHQQSLRDHMAAVERDAAAEVRSRNMSAQRDILNQRSEQASMRATAKAANSNQVDPAFFRQFGTSDR